MVIAGLQKMTLLDYPGKIACTVFLQGCNFRCPFCHNSGLLGGACQDPIMEDELLAFLQKRVGLLDGVCVTGGEPTLQKELPDFLRKIKALGYAVKLDTNGSDPDMLRRLAEAGLVDYVAMDIKNSPQKYAATAGVSKLSMEKLEESIRFLIGGRLDYELRTTVVQELHSRQDFEQMGRWFQKICPDRKPKKIFLQAYTHRDSVLTGGLHAPEKTQLLDFLDAILPFVHKAEIRGVD